MPYTAGGCHRQEKPVKAFKSIKIYLCYFNCKVYTLIFRPLNIANDYVANENTRVKQAEAKVRDTKHSYWIGRGSKMKPSTQELIVKRFPCRHKAGGGANSVNKSTQKIRQNTHDWKLFSVPLASDFLLSGGKGI